MCEYAALLSGHIDQMNTAEEEARLRSHLRECAHCRELLRQMERNDAALRMLPAEPAEELTARIMNSVRSQPRKRRFGKRLIPVAAAAAVAVLVFAFSGTLSELFMSKDAASNECAPYNAAVREISEDLCVPEGELPATDILRPEAFCSASLGKRAVFNGEALPFVLSEADDMLLLQNPGADGADAAEPYSDRLTDWLFSVYTLLSQTLPDH